MIFVKDFILYNYSILERTISPSSELYGFIIAGAIFIFIIALVFSILFLLEGDKKASTSKSDNFTTSEHKEKSVDFKATYNSLRKAYLTKENADSYLRRLDELKTDGNINEQLYTMLKNEYLIEQQKNISMIDGIQTELKRQLNVRLDELTEVKNKLTNMEISLQTRQISSSLFINREKSFTARIGQLENEITELKMLIDAKSSDDIVPTINIKKSTGKFKPQRDQSSSIKPPEVSQPLESEETNPEIADVSGQTNIGTADRKEETSDNSIMLPKISDLKILPEVVMEGGDVGITVRIFNDKNKNITYQAYLKINGKTYDSRSVMLTPGNSQEITFIYTSNAPGDFSVELEGLRGKFKVLPTQLRS